MDFISHACRVKGLTRKSSVRDLSIDHLHPEDRVGRGNCVVCHSHDSRVLLDFEDSMKVMECPNCGLVYTFPIAPHEVADLYEEEYF